ncbi:hypothetical protein [Notoacmeibacter marinus]|nr:hypothetical protein [Notoacmeibacter marinus]
MNDRQMMKETLFKLLPGGEVSFAYEIVNDAFPPGSEDLDARQRICEFADQLGCDVFFDQEPLTFKKRPDPA